VSELALHWVDVFTDVPFSGNALAVFPDADGLDEEQMQDIAAELNLSETTFVFGGAEQVRIFTPESELPLAGHPMVGTAYVLASLGRLPVDGQHVVKTGVGETTIEVSGDTATMTQAPFDPGKELEPARMADLLRIGVDQVVGTPRACSTITEPQALVQVPDRETLAGITPDLYAVSAFTDAMGVGAWCENEGELALRFFVPGMGIPEDPATGSLAGALGCMRVFEGGEPGSVLVRQGEEIGRPSEIHVTVTGRPGAPEPPRVGGSVVPVMTGTFSL
jgi:trans-2,3-dihydro-3-hydroxyanthranilate isomerase